MHSYLKDDVISRQKANWEISNDKRNQAQMTSEEKRRLKEQKQTFLDLRRKRLSDLLISEDIMYHNEIIRNQETPEDVRRKMEKKLNELKTQRELERQKLVKKLKTKIQVHMDMAARFKSLEMKTELLELITLVSRTMMVIFVIAQLRRNYMSGIATRNVRKNKESRIRLY